MLLEFPMLAERMELEVNGLRLYATHGHLWNEQFPPAMEEGTVLIHGHFHMPACVSHGTWLSVNPGSAAFPRAGSVKSYVLLSGRTFLWKALDDGKVYQSYTAEREAGGAFSCTDSWRAPAPP